MGSANIEVYRNFCKRITLPYHYGKVSKITMTNLDKRKNYS